MEYSEKIKKFMSVKGINNRDLSHKLNKSEAQISRWTKAKKPSIDFLLLMKNLYPDFDLNYILTELKPYEDLDYFANVAEEDVNYSKSPTELIKEIEERLIVLKEKVAQNSHK